MGCAVSRLDGNGMALPPMLHHTRPELVPHDPRESSDENAPDAKTTRLSLKEGSYIRVANEKAPKELGAYSGSDWEEKIGSLKENGGLADGDGRRIGHGLDEDDDVAFPGSPSFRVYFKDNGEDKHTPIGDEGETPKEFAENKKATIKIDKKKKSSKKALPKGRQLAVKHIFSYKSCYCTRPSSGHDQTGLLTAKTTD